MTKRLGWPWWCGAVFFGVLILVGAFYFDANLRAWVVEHQNPDVRKFMLAVSHWGDWPSHVVVGGVAAVAAYFLGRHDWLRIFIAMIIACTLAGAVTRVIKISVGRSRPSVTESAGWNGPRLSSKYHAFPSGHTASTVAFFAVLAFARCRIILALWPIPLLIATSRVSVDAHHLSDVTCAAMLGVLCAFLVWRFISFRYPVPA